MNALEKWSIVFSIVLGSLALIITVWQGCETKEFNRLSLKPNIQTNYLYDSEREEFHLKIKSAGVGPAIIDDVAFIKSGGKKYLMSDPKGFWKIIFNDSNISDSIIMKKMSVYTLKPHGFAC